MTTPAYLRAAAETAYETAALLEWAAGEIERLREALGPFSNWADVYDEPRAVTGNPIGGDEPVVNLIGVKLDVDDLRRARAAFNGGSDG